jgi:hypothetical protein
MLAGLQPQLLNSGAYYAEFEDADDVYKYYLEISIQNVVSEKLEINNDEKLIRFHDGMGEIYADELKRKIKFQLPSNQLVVVSKRDAIQHPYLKKLSDWAGGMRMYSFSLSLGKDIGFPIIDMNQLVVDSRDPNQVAVLYAKGAQEFGDKFNNLIISRMKELDYDLKEIGIAPNPATPATARGYANMIYLSEEHLALFQPYISQGMFRALSLIISITYNILKNLPTTVLIDDIGEGLDFDRSAKLIKLLMDIANINDLQLIMSTNDRFVMNTVPLEYWQVIQRAGGECKVFNYQNSKEKFDEFEYMGLNNFDFLATDYLNSEWKKI